MSGGKRAALAVSVGTRLGVHDEYALAYAELHASRVEDLLHRSHTREFRSTALQEALVTSEAVTEALRAGLGVSSPTCTRKHVCLATHEGYTCTMPEGHARGHVAHDQDGTGIHHWPRGEST